MSSPTRISPQEASEKMKEGWTYVDVRTEQEFEAGHPEGAFNVPLMHAGGGGMVPNADFLAVMGAAFPKDAKIIVGCKAGGRSLKAANMLLGAGFTSVIDQRAGWDGARNPFGQVTEPGWSRVGLPTTDGRPPGHTWGELQKKQG
jgi:rhodanese-related sulfurtransferase